MGRFFTGGKEIESSRYNPETEKADWIAIAMDQLLGPDTGRVFNDQAAAVATGGTTPDAAVKAIQDSWSQNKM